MAQKYVNESDDLDSLAEAHAVRKDTSQAIARFVTLQRFDHVVVEKAYSADLQSAINKVL